MNTTATSQEAINAETTQKMPPAPLADYRRADPTGKPRRGHQRAGQHQEGGGVPGERGGADPVDALLDLHHHHLDHDDGVIDQETERDDEGAKGDAVQVEAHGIHGDEDDGEHQGHRQGDHNAAAPAERRKLTRRTIPSASMKD